MSTFKVNKNGEADWHKVEAETAQSAIENHFDVKVFHFNNRGQIQLFEDANANYQLYAACLD